MKKKGGRFFASKATGIKGNKKRSETLTEAGMEKLGQIDDPAYLAFKSLMDMNRDVANAKLFRDVNKFFGSTKEFDGSIKIPSTKRFEVRQGAIADAATKIKGVNETLNPLLTELKATFKENRKATSMINKMEKEIAQYQGKGLKELEKLAKFGEDPRTSRIEVP